MTRTAESGTRARTRRAIITAAAAVLVERPTASLSDVADAAEVARSTVHRYFRDRGELMTALADHVVERADAAMTEAALDVGTSADALRRLATSCFDLGPLLLFLVRELAVVDNDHPLMRRLEESDDPVTALVRRGLDDGTLDPAFDAEWIRSVFWAVVYTGWEAVDEGRAPRPSAIAAVVRTLEKALFARA